MDTEVFKKSAKFIVSRNINEHVEAVFADFDSEKGSLNLIYCTKGAPTEDDEEDCELSCTELVAHFPEIRIAETRCVPAKEGALPVGMIKLFSCD